MSSMIKQYISGKCVLSIFEGEYEGNKTYSFTLQKMKFSKKENKIEYTGFFSPTDCGDLIGLIWKILISPFRIKEKTRAQGQAQGLQNSQYQQKPLAEKYPEDDKIAF